jgi:Domain of unknown function (DUF5664)
MNEQSNTLGVNPKDLLGIKKVQLNLVPASSTIYQALAMEDGARKYGPYNWRANRVIASIYVAAALRHLQSWYDEREELASDSGKPHLGHALACIGILVDALETGNLADDRPLPGAAARLIAKWEKKPVTSMTGDVVALTGDVVATVPGGGSGGGSGGASASMPSRVQDVFTQG